MEAREQRGLEIASLLPITHAAGVWTVPSQRGTGRYKVRLTPGAPTCTCPDHGERGVKCKHIFAAEQFTRETVEPARWATPSPAPEATPRPVASTLPPIPRPTYPQTWPAYNAAQTNEKDRFLELLFELCRGIQEPPKARRKGQQPLLLMDAVFACVFKVYSTVSGRRFMSDLRAAHERGHISALPHFNSIFNYLDRPEMTPVLKAMIVESSKPLAAVEHDFAADSTGFATSRFVRWFDHKYGVVKVEYDWVKVHVMCGVKTNVVTAVEIKDRDAQDGPQLPALLSTTAEHFAMREVSADKGYSSVGSVEAIAAHGAAGFIPFKSIHSGRSGGLWAKMFHFYSFQRDEFLAHYHKRSNVETTFSMIKAKFGDAIRSKTDVAMTNEALCKVLCHNVCCVIQSMYELGIAPAFGMPVLPPGERFERLA